MTFSWRPFKHLDFVLRTLRALRPEALNKSSRFIFEKYKKEENGPRFFSDGAGVGGGVIGIAYSSSCMILEKVTFYITAVSSRNIKREHLNGKMILTLFLHTIVNLS